jgi:dipeptidyl aminopeptidase/acylaminoacyl peptidase
MLLRLAFYIVCLLATTVRAAPPVDPYGRLPGIEEVAISPDGTKVALIHTTADLRVLAILRLEDGKLLSGIRLGEAKIREVEWADDEHLMLTTASTGMPMGLIGEPQEWHLLQVYDLNTHKVKPLLERGGDSHTRTMNVVFGRPVVHRQGSETLVYLHGIYVEDVTMPALFRVSLTTGRESIVRKGTAATNEWLIGDDGGIVAEQDYVERARRWEIRLFKDGKVSQTIAGNAPIDSPNMLGLSADGDAIITSLADEDGRTWKPLLLKDGSWGPDISPGVRLTNVILDRNSHRMIGTATLDDTATYRFFDPDLQENWNWITRVFGGDRVELVSMSSDHSQFIVKTFGPRHGYTYQHADLREHLIEPLGNVYDGIGPIAEVRRIDYKAADGLSIPAYLTLPPGSIARNLPLIVMPHGGPAVRDRLDFDWWAQALAAQGYAVLQPNYRGSNLTRRWVEAGFGEWGRKMQTDLSDGVRFLAREGIADPKRVCIVGASYGGYAALAGVTLESGVYRCAVAVSGVSDPRDFLAWVARKEAYGAETGLRYWDRFLGVAGRNDDKLDAISPVKHASEVSVPILLIHGKEDTTVPYDQSEDMAKALKRAGKPLEFVSLAKEDHYLSRSATRLQMLKTSVDFLQRNNPSDPTPSVGVAAEH